MGSWLAFPVAPRLQTLVDDLFTDLMIREEICWVVPQSAVNAPNGRRHVWDASSEMVDMWRDRVAIQLKKRRGRLPTSIDGIDMREAWDQELRFHSMNGRDKNLKADVMAAACIFYNSLQKWMEQGNQLDGAFLWNHWGYQNAILRGLCKKQGKPYWYMEQGLLADTLCFSRKGLYHSAHESGMLEKPIVPSLADVEKHLSYYRDKCVIEGDHELFEMPSVPNVILVTGQLDDDSSIIFRSQSCLTNIDLLEALKGAFGTILFKPHPLDNTNYHKVTDAHWKLVPKKVDLHALIRRCNVVVTRNSTSGIEAIIEDKPVVHTGDAIYDVSILSTKAHPKQLVDAINHVRMDPPPKRKAWKEEKLKFFRWLIGQHLYLSSDHPAPLRRASVSRIQAEFEGARWMKSISS